MLHVSLAALVQADVGVALEELRPECHGRERLAQLMRHERREVAETAVGKLERALGAPAKRVLGAEGRIEGRELEGAIVDALLERGYEGPDLLLGRAARRDFVLQRAIGANQIAGGTPLAFEEVQQGRQQARDQHPRNQDHLREPGVEGCAQGVRRTRP